MSAWLGLHNPERHRVEASGLTSCRNCADTGCSRVCPCWCCLQAEVERLTEALAERDQKIADALAYCDDWKPIAFGWKIERILRGES